jgi:hypothetical protein
VRDAIGGCKTDRFFSGYGSRADRTGWLVYNRALPMLEPSAVLFTFATAFRKREETRVAAVRGESSLLLLQTAVANVNRQASGSRIGGVLSYSSKRRRTPRTPQPIIFFLFFIHPAPPNLSRAL